jgi:hypothetical protein
VLGAHPASSISAERLKASLGAARAPLVDEIGALVAELVAVNPARLIATTAARDVFRINQTHLGTVIPPSHGEE